MSSESPIDASERLSEEELRARLAECENTNRQVAELVSRVRHEINNPLTGVLGHAQLLLREDLSDKVKQRLQKIEELALRTTAIAAELREVKKPAPRPATNTDQNEAKPPS